MNDATFKSGTRAEVVLDSVSPAGARLTTIEVTMHRFVLAEFNTHRVFSRNSASSRAIPFSKQVERVLNNPAVPVEWRAEQSGMQGGELLPEQDAWNANQHWLAAREAAVFHAKTLAELGVHKSIVNRLLEPFMWHTVIVTATEWDGFWAQRRSELAQPEIRVAAEAMWEAYDDSEPAGVEYGQWHTPYISEDDWEEARDLWPDEDVIDGLKKVSVARCARVSYLTHHGSRSLEADLKLFSRLASAEPMHASPFEHVATPARIYSPPGNLVGWYQFRHDFQPSPYEREVHNDD